MKQMIASCPLVSVQIDTIGFHHSVTAAISNSAGFKLIDEHVAVFELSAKYLFERTQYEDISAVIQNVPAPDG